MARKYWTDKPAELDRAGRGRMDWNGMTGRDEDLKNASALVAGLMGMVWYAVTWGVWLFLG